jgi:hypothetical protein
LACAAVADSSLAGRIGRGAGERKRRTGEEGGEDNYNNNITVMVVCVFVVSCGQWRCRGVSDVVCVLACACAWVCVGLGRLVVCVLGVWCVGVGLVGACVGVLVSVVCCVGWTATQRKLSSAVRLVVMVAVAVVSMTLEW